MSKLQEYIESNAIRRLTEEQQDRLALMVDDGDEQALAEWCNLNEVRVESVKKWARTGILAAGLAIGGSEPLLAEDDIPAWIRNKANQTTFAQTAQSRMQGKEVQRIDPNAPEPRPGRQDQRRGHWDSGRGGYHQHGGYPYDDHPNYRRGMLWDPYRSMWVNRPRTGIYFSIGNRPVYDPYNPYWQANQMHMRMQQPGYQQAYPAQGSYGFADDEDQEDYTMPSTGGPGVVPPDPAPPPNAQVDIDSDPEGGDGTPANEPIQDTPSKTVMYDFGGQQVAFKPFPTPIEIARARQMGAFNTQVRLKNQPNAANALVYEKNGIKHVLLLPRN